MDKNILDQNTVLPTIFFLFAFILYLVFCYALSLGEKWYVIGVVSFAAALYLATQNKIFESSYGPSKEREHYDGKE